MSRILVAARAAFLLSAAGQKACVLTPAVAEDTPLGGASAGSLVVVCHHAGLEPARVTEACLKLAADCRKSGTRGRLGTVLEKVLVEILPEDSHERVKGKAFVSDYPLQLPSSCLEQRWHARRLCILSLAADA